MEEIQTNPPTTQAGSTTSNKAENSQPTDNGVRKLIISADAIFDTRIGTLQLINPEFAFKVSTNPEYYQREADIFSVEGYGALSREKYLEVKKRFGDRIIRSSPKTRIFQFLSELYVQIQCRAQVTPYLQSLDVEINFHPYNLSAKEQTYICALVAERMSKDLSIRAVNIAPEQLKLREVGASCYAMVLYDYADWLNMHDASFRQGVMKNTTLYLPRLNAVRPLTEQERAELKHHDPFDVIMRYLSPFCKMQFLPISAYCIDTPLNPEAR